MIMGEQTVFDKVRNMIEAHYPVLYLTTFEYGRTKQKLNGILSMDLCLLTRKVV